MPLPAHTLAHPQLYPDGTTQMALLGGGGPQTLWGYQLAAVQQARLGLAAGVGQDLPSHCKVGKQRAELLDFSTMPESFISP